MLQQVTITTFNMFLTVEKLDSFINKSFMP